MGFYVSTDHEVEKDTKAEELITVEIHVDVDDVIGGLDMDGLLEIGGWLARNASDESLRTVGLMTVPTESWLAVKRAVMDGDVPTLLRLVKEKAWQEESIVIPDLPNSNR